MKLYLFFFLIAGISLFSGCDSETNDPEVNPVEIKSKINVKAQVGSILYEDVNATVEVDAFGPEDELKWSKKFDYTGTAGETLLSIPAGYQYYVISASVWGSEDSQTISGQQLYDERSDGPNATTYVFAPEVQAPELTSVIRQLERQVGEETVMVPYSMEEFIWTDNRLSGIKDSEYNEETEAFTLARYFLLEYENNRVKKITGFQAADDAIYIETTYEYNANGSVSKITEANFGTGVTTEATLQYDNSLQQISVQYNLSNGQNLVYKFNQEWKNPISDQTLKGSTLCNEGTYSFDKNINPYRHLGYLDLLMSNVSVNNKISEDVHYLACAFPDMLVESIDYTYNERGLPDTRTNTYSNGKKGMEVYTY